MKLEDVQAGDIVDITENTGATYRTKVIRIHPDNLDPNDQCIEGEMISIRWMMHFKEYEPGVIGDHSFSTITRIEKVEDD